jgi:hypothetical protein
MKGESVMRLKWLVSGWQYRDLGGFVVLNALILTLGCQQPRVDTVVIKPETCPLPEELSSVDQDKVKKFGAEISGLMTSLAGGKIDADVQSALKRTYPDAGDVNRIYALSYAACVSCRLDPNDVKACANQFDKIIDSFTTKKVDSDHPSKTYRSKLMKPLRGPK